MIAMVCELCSSKNFSKLEDGYYQCDYCRTKYTPPQAKKLLVEGTVKINRVEELANLLVIAGNAVATCNWVEVESYAKRALEIDPNNSEAWLYSGAASARSIAPDALNIRRALHAFQNAQANASWNSEKNYRDYVLRELGILLLPDEACAVIDKQRALDFRTTFIERVLPLFDRSDALLDAANFAYSLSDGNVAYLQNAAAIGTTLIVISDLPKDNPDPRAAEYQGRIHLLRGRVNDLNQRIKTLDPTYTPQKLRPGSANCFVVTAAMGGEENFAVRVLRDFRDEVLTNASLGKAFIKRYYEHGPGAAQLISRFWILRALAFTLIVVPSIAVALPTLVIFRSLKPLE